MPLEELDLLEALEELEELEPLELLEPLVKLEPTRENRSLLFEASNALSQIGICQDKSSH